MLTYKAHLTTGPGLGGRANICLGGFSVSEYWRNAVSMQYQNICRKTAIQQYINLQSINIRCAPSPAAPVGCPTLRYTSGTLLFDANAR